MIINLFFCFASSFAAQIFLFDCKMTQEISEGDVGNGKWLGMANYNIRFKNQSFSNEHKQIFFSEKNMHVRRLIKVNNKRSL